MVRAKTRKRIAWTLITLGLLGVYIPHIAFIAELIPTLDVISHSVLEIISATVILIGAFILGRKR